MTAWPGGLAASPLFTEDLAATRQFYLNVVELPVGGVQGSARRW